MLSIPIAANIIACIQNGYPATLTINVAMLNSLLFHHADQSELHTNVSGDIYLVNHLTLEQTGYVVNQIPNELRNISSGNVCKEVALIEMHDGS